MGTDLSKGVLASCEASFFVHFLSMCGSSEASFVQWLSSWDHSQIAVSSNADRTPHMDHRDKRTKTRQRQRVAFSAQGLFSRPELQSLGAAGLVF